MDRECWNCWKFITAQHDLVTTEKIHKLMIGFWSFWSIYCVRSYQNICFYGTEISYFILRVYGNLDGSIDLNKALLQGVKNQIKSQLKLLFDTINLILKRAIVIGLKILFSEGGCWHFQRPSQNFWVKTEWSCPGLTASLFYGFISALLSPDSSSLDGVIW